MSNLGWKPDLSHFLRPTFIYEKVQLLGREMTCLRSRHVFSAVGTRHRASDSDLVLRLLPALPDFHRFPELVPRACQMQGEAISLSLGVTLPLPASLPATLLIK